MASKQELIGMLEEAINFEEKAAPLVYEKFKACLEEMKTFDMLEEDKEKIHNLFLVLVNGADSHERRLRELIEEVRKSDRDEF